MDLAQAPAQYDKTDQDRVRGTLSSADKQNVKQGNVFDKILMRDTADGKIKTIVMTSGALVIT